MSSDDLEDGIVLANEFGSAHVRIDRGANGARLVVEDPRSGARVFLDPFELQCLAYLTARDIKEFMRPSFQERDDLQVPDGLPLPS